MTAQVARQSRFWDRIAEKYARQPIGDVDQYEKKLALTQKHLRPTDRVLELGGGTGSTALRHAPHVAEILCTDISAKMIAIGERKAKAEGVENIRFAQGTDADLDVTPGSFDVVLALNLIHLVPDPQGSLARMREMLKPGGLLVASTACVADIMPVFRLIAPPLTALGIFPKVSVFKERAYSQWLVDAGFTTEDYLPAKGRSAVFHILRAPG